MPEQATRPVNKYLPPRDRNIDILAPLLDPLPAATAASSAGSTGPRPPLMHPAPSIIAFTTLTGLGFGLMASLGIAAARPLARRLSGPSHSRSPALASSRACSTSASRAGSSRPSPSGAPRGSAARRCWRSPPSPPSACSPGSGCSPGPQPAPRRRRPALALATVAATSMIYAQMRSVPRWRSPLTPRFSFCSRSPAAPFWAGASRAAPWLLGAVGLAQLAACAHGDRGFAAAGTPSPPPPASARLAGCGCSSRPIPAQTTCCARWSSSSAATTRASSASSASPWRWLAPACPRARVDRPARAGARRRPARRRRARAALALLRGGRTCGWTLLRKAVRRSPCEPEVPPPVAKARNPRWNAARRLGPRAAAAPAGRPRSAGGARRKGLRILLITSRDTGRWVIPKGWPMKNRSDAEAAAREAYEEAGSARLLSRSAASAFTPTARCSAPERAVPVAVRVFPLEVREMLRQYPETGQRRVKWFAPRQGRRAGSPSPSSRR